MKITKRELRQIIREAVDTPDREALLRRIVDEKQADHVEGQLVDLFTASAIVSILDGLNPTNRERYLSIPIENMAKIAFKMMK